MTTVATIPSSLIGQNIPCFGDFPIYCTIRAAGIYEGFNSAFPTIYIHGQGDILSG